MALIKKMTMKHNFFGLILIVLLFICCINNKQTDKKYYFVTGSEIPIKYDKFEKKVKMHKELIDYTTEIYAFKKYLITIASDRYCDSIDIFIQNRLNKREIKIHKGLGCEYFKGIYNDIAFFDEGTGITRTTILYDMISGKDIATLRTNGNIKINNNKIYIDNLDISKDQLKGKNIPYCSDTIPCDGCGEIAEVIYYDINTRKIIHTGKIKCAFE